MYKFFQTLIYLRRILYFTLLKMFLLVSKKLKDTVDKPPEINWSEVARQSSREKVTNFLFFIFPLSMLF